WRAWRYRLRLDPAEISFVRAHLRPGQHAVDIGAHKGGYLYWMRRAVGSSGRTFAFEVQPELAAYLRRVLAGDPAVVVEQAGSARISGALFSLRRPPRRRRLHGGPPARPAPPALREQLRRHTAAVVAATPPP